MKVQGIFPALTTCFDHDGNVYKTKIFHNIEKLNRVALSGYVICGSTGETPLLTTEERIQVLEWVREASSEDKILIAGVGAESVHETVSLANRAAQAGYNAALVLTPHYYPNQMHRPDTQALFFRAVADRNCKSLCTAAFAHRPSLCKHVRRRTSLSYVHFPDKAYYSGYLYRPAFIRFIATGIYIYFARDDLRRWRRIARTLRHHPLPV